MKKNVIIVFLFGYFSLFAQEEITFYFESNKFELTKNEAVRLQKWIAANGKSKILSISGATDEVGSSGYNDTLSEKRVACIYNKIKDKVAIRADFKSVSLGETGATSKDNSRNRKASIVFLQQKDLAKEADLIPEVVRVEEASSKPEKIEIPDGLSLKEKVALATIGTKIVLKNIHFYQNTFATVPEAQTALWDLFQVMKDNPNLKIEIQGHICCIDKDYRNLSSERAKQIKRFLVFQGIPQQRIQTKGFGVSQPLHPIPEASEEQAAANRRVEIEIISK